MFRPYHREDKPSAAVASTSRQFQHMFRLIALAVAFMAIVSCAYMVSHEKAVDSLGKARSCCESIAQFRYDQLTEGKGVKFNLNETSDAFTFETGKSYFKAFRLPDKAVPYRLRIRSFAMGEQLYQAHIFYPQLALLDEHFAIIRQSTARDFLLSKAGWVEIMSENWGLQLKFEGYARVDDPGAKYVLIFTTQELMSTTSPYEVMSWSQLFLPVYGVVAAIPTGREIVYIKHSPFGRLHLEIVATIPTICRDGGEKDIKPKSAISARFAGRDARIFVSAMEPGADTTHFDTIIILRGRDVFGGTVAVGLKDGCLAGRKFLTSLDYIYATQMVALFRSNPALQRSDRLEVATLQAMAEAGNPPAQFYVGLMHAWGWSGITRDRKAAIEWLTLSAQQGFSPAMLALGLALSGYGVLEQETAARPSQADEYTDLVTAYSWLNAARSSSERDVRNEASFQLKQLSARMSQDELKNAEESLHKRSGARK